MAFQLRNLTDFLSTTSPLKPHS